MRTYVSSPTNFEIPVARPIDTMEAGGFVHAPAQPIPMPDANANARADLRANLPNRSTRRFSKCAIATIAIPALLTTGGLVMIGDGIRKRVQAGGFAKPKCRQNGVLVPIDPSGATVCDKYVYDGHGYAKPVVEYDPADPGSPTAFGEITDGISVAASGAVGTCLSVCLVQMVCGGLRS